MFTRTRNSTIVVVTALTLGLMALPASGDVVSGGPKVGQWKTWVLSSGNEKERSPSANTAIQYYNAGPATQRWNDLAFALARADKRLIVLVGRQALLDRADGFAGRGLWIAPTKRVASSSPALLRAALGSLIRHRPRLVGKRCKPVRPSNPVRTSNNDRRSSPAATTRQKPTHTNS